ncbi:hypothetical protein KIPB_016270, partial [Kipferlia bialata]
AKHRLTGSFVAIKIIPKVRLLASRQVVDRVRREINIMRMFRHPHIIQLYDVVDSPDAIHI